MMKLKAKRQSGFSLLEMLVVVGIFALITGVVFQLLDLSQQRYRMESEVLASFQSARLAMDQLARDVHASGYPPANQFMPAVAAANPERVALPFGFSPGYPGVPGCLLGVCRTPGPFDVIVEADIDPENNNGIEWIRYRLNGRTLERGVATKVAGADPDLTTAPNLTAYVENVVNNTTAAEMNELRTFYPAIFPGNVAVPVFTYMCQVGTAAVVACTGANGPRDIREVNITLMVRSASNDPRNRQPRTLTLTGRARRINPSS